MTIPRRNQLLPLLGLMAAIGAASVILDRPMHLLAQPTPQAGQPAPVIVTGGGVTSSGTALGPVLFQNGSSAAPSISFASEPTLGLFRPGAGYLGFAELGNFDWASGGTNFIMQSGGAIGFSSTTNPFSGSFDTKIVRAAAGQLTYTATTFAALGTPANGTAAYCSDCTVTTPATCPATAASCVCAGSGTGAFAYRLNGVWDCVIRQ